MFGLESLMEWDDESKNVKPVERTAFCPGCEKTFSYSWRYVKAPEACSHECYLAWKARKVPAKPTLTIHCEYCGAEAPAKNKTKKFCNRTCQKRGETADRLGISCTELYEIRQSGCGHCGKRTAAGREVSVDIQDGKIVGGICLPCLISRVHRDRHANARGDHSENLLANVGN